MVAAFFCLWIGVNVLRNKALGQPTVQNALQESKGAKLKKQFSNLFFSAYFLHSQLCVGWPHQYSCSLGVT